VKVAICGTHGIGKTTLLHKIAQHEDFPQGMHVAAEAARTVAEALGIESLSDLPEWERTLIDRFQWRVFAEQVAIEIEYPNLIIDRSVIDNLAYTRYYACGWSMTESITDFVKMWAQSYDLLLYCPIPRALHTDAINDCFRLTNVSSVGDVDTAIRGILFESRELEALETVVVLPSTTSGDWTDEWAEIAVSIIRNEYHEQ
jgi:predicted ATPase